MVPNHSHLYHVVITCKQALLALFYRQTSELMSQMATHDVELPI